MRKYDMTIGGEPVAGGRYEGIFNPANPDEIVGQAAIGSGEDLDRAVAAAAEAFKSWSKTGDEERQEACRKIGDIFAAHAGELAELLTRETGKPLKGAGSEFEAGGCVAWANATADLRLSSHVIQDDDKVRIEAVRVPVGVVGSITPWNWPALIAVWHVLPAIRTGNTVVIKPSPYTPLNTLRLVELMNEVLPPGVVNCVSGGNELGAAMSRHPGIAKIVFTGSIPTGKKIMESSAVNLKRLTLELGGNDPGIVLDDAAPRAIAQRVFWGAFINSGQTCAALKRLYVPDALYDQVCAELVALAETIPMGDGLDPDSALGPLQNRAQFDKICALVDSARADGARILSGGAPMGKGYFYPVTIVAEAKDGMRIVDEEQFGPVLPVIRYTSLDQAIAAANGLDYGLAASVWSSDPARASEVATRLDAGTVYVNSHADVAPNVPFGGVKHSGLGVEFGEVGLEAYTNIKVYSLAR
jgi:acyl-CoA reductase-like NAD-dependent aldehyde dehydrogenase